MTWVLGTGPCLPPPGTVFLCDPYDKLWNTIGQSLGLLCQSLFYCLKDKPCHRPLSFLSLLPDSHDMSFFALPHSCHHNIRPHYRPKVIEWKDPGWHFFLSCPCPHAMVSHVHSTKKVSLALVHIVTCLSSLRAQVNAICSVVPRLHVAQIKLLW